MLIALEISGGHPWVGDMTESGAWDDGPALITARCPSTHHSWSGSALTTTAREEPQGSGSRRFLAGSWDVCRHFSLLQSGSAVVHGGRVWALLGEYWPREQTSRLKSGDRGLKQCGKGHGISRNPSLLLANRWWLQICSAVGLEKKKCI